ncbi:phospholipase D-like domain-containing protein [Amaricoccus tamworthensis]|uniref:phospholipase D-like domain-containing protein n=1 Tax=Amaricoccus tamworthensis TaxID=57002 RepID=UPI003C7DF90A
MANGSLGSGNARVLLTAAEAYPCLEELFLEAKDRVVAGFRIFDPRTRLRSNGGWEVGKTWSDLIRAVIERGVDVTLILADFDPVHRPGLHRTAHSSVREFHRAVEGVEGGGKLTVHAAMHPAQVGYWHRIAFRGFEIRTLQRHVDMLNDKEADAREWWLRDAPGIRKMIKAGPDGKLALRRGLLPRMYPASHHQKLAVIDGKTLFVGGLDVNERRFDGPDHDRPAEQTWHDVQLCLRDSDLAPVAEEHLLAFEDECAGKRPVEERQGLLRTLSTVNHKWGSRLGPQEAVRDIRDRIIEEIRRSEKLIYLETQYFRDEGIARELAQRAREVPGLQLIAVLPAAPDDVAFEGSTSLDARFGEHLQAECVETVLAAFDGRCAILSPGQPENIEDHESDFAFYGSPLVYVHAKVAIFDDHCAIIGSANLNGRSLKWDTEVAVALEEREAVRDLRRRLFEHWLPEDAGEEFTDPDGAAKAWWDLAEANTKLEPDERRGFVLPFPLQRAKEFGRPVPFVPHAMV